MANNSGNVNIDDKRKALDARYSTDREAVW